MARLPVPGSDADSWGDILNNFLLQAHTNGGTLKSNSVGAAQLQDGAVSQSKLDTDTQDAVAKAANGLVWRGAWSSVSSYITNDIVAYDGALYVATQDVSSATTPNADVVHWTLFADSVPVGSRSGALRALALGTSSVVDSLANDAVAIGSSAQAFASQSTALGHAADVSDTADSSVAIGVNSSVQASRAIAIGDQASTGASASDGVAVGSFTSVGGQGAVGVGGDSAASGSHATAVGNASTASGASATALGTGARATQAGSVAIGADSGGISASSTTANRFVLGTSSHTVQIPGKLRVDTATQTTVGAAGAASALPATPVKYLSVTASDGVEYVIPLYNKS